MKILLLTNKLLNDKFCIEKLIRDKLDKNILLHVNENKIKLDETIDYDFIISFGYRFIVKKDIIEHFGKKIINCHISYLPYNRGSDPNLWSLLTDTPSGVTIHLLTEGLDEGDIIYQKIIKISDEETMTSSYEILIKSITELLLNNIDNLLYGNFTPIPQNHSNHTSFKLKDRPDFKIICPDSWNTKRKEVKRLYIENYIKI
tara:strand:- start:207 stop:812 length:606 start_codon:yes stop_codon:yes gene_type:complete